MNLQLKDPSGNVLVSLESTPVTPTVESMTTDLVEATKAVESAFDETEKYSNAMAVMSTEGFGEQAKAVASKVWEKIKEFFKKLIEWLKKFRDFIVNKALKFKISKIKDPSAKQQMSQLVNDMNGVSEKLDKSSSEFVATIDGVKVDVETADAEKLNEMKSAQDVSNHVRKTIQGMASVMNNLAETEMAIDESFDTVKKATAEREKTMQMLRETMTTAKKEADAVARKDFNEANKIKSEANEKIVNLNKQFASMMRNKDGSQFNGTFDEFMKSKDTVFVL